MKGASAFPGIVILAIVSGCVQTTVDRYVKVPDSSVDSAYVKPDVDFSRYRKLQPAPLEIYYHEGQAEPDPEDLARLRQTFRKAFLAAIGDDYEIVDAAGPDVLGVRATVVDLEMSPELGELPIKGRAAQLVAAGHLSFFMELTDSQTGEVLGRAGDEEKDVEEVVAYDEQRDWGRAEKAAERWAQLFRSFLDENLGR
jgi:hypothetical protein